MPASRRHVGEEGSVFPKLVAGPLGEGVVMALGALQLHSQEQPGRAARQVLRLVFIGLEKHRRRSFGRVAAQRLRQHFADQLVVGGADDGEGNPAAAQEPVEADPLRPAPVRAEDPVHIDRQAVPLAAQVQGVAVLVAPPLVTAHFSWLVLGALVVLCCVYKSSGSLTAM